MSEAGRADGPTRSVLLLHAGIADSRMWGPQIEPLTSAGGSRTPIFGGSGIARTGPGRSPT